MNREQREAQDRMIYNHLIDFLSDHMTREQAEREISRQTSLSLRVVRAAIRRHVLRSA